LNSRVVEESPNIIIYSSAVGLIVVEAKHNKGLETIGSLQLCFADVCKFQIVRQKG
jgi:hypothetical protein